MMHMKKTTILLASLAASLCCLNAAEDIFKPVRDTKLRAPAYPLVTIDPYASAWSFSDALNGDSVRHWTGREPPLVGAVRVDGKVYRFMGGKGANYKTIIPMSAAEPVGRRLYQNVARWRLDFEVLRRLVMEARQGGFRYGRHAQRFHRMEGRRHMGAPHI